MTYVEADHSNCVAKATYQAAIDELVGWRNHKCPTANHNGCVSQSEYNSLNSKYQTALNRISDLEAEVAELKAHKCPGADHTACNSKIKALEAEIAQLKAHNCDHSNCGTGTTIIQADHSNCVSLRDYNELLEMYNALLDN
jgi:FtsZ-binding cell division protein ZapB